MADSGEKDLASRVLNGDLDAFGALIQEHQSSVFNVCYRILGNRQEAEDLTQEAFIRAYKKLSRYDPSRPFGPWMRTLAANLCYNHLRKGRLQRVSLEDEKDNSKTILSGIRNSCWKFLKSTGAFTRHSGSFRIIKE